MITTEHDVDGMVALLRVIFATSMVGAITGLLCLFGMLLDVNG